MANPIVKLVFILAVVVFSVLRIPLVLLKNIWVAIRVVANSYDTVSFYREVINARKRVINAEEKGIKDCEARILELMQK